MGPIPHKHNLSVALLSGGVGGARMARALIAALDPSLLTVIVNVGDDDEIYGLRVSPDLDTVTYTLAGIEGPDGWGVAGDTFAAMQQLAALGVDTTFRLGDRDLATCLYRTNRLAEGAVLSDVTAEIVDRHGIDCRILPATDDPLRTALRTIEGRWLGFQEYFVHRGHRDVIAEVHFSGADSATAAPGVLTAIADSDLVLIAPSNPVVSVWPILAVPAIEEALRNHRRVTAVSPLFGGTALKGPAAELLRSTGLGEGNQAVAAAYPGLITHLIVDTSDAADVEALGQLGIAADAMGTLLTNPASAGDIAAAMVAAAAASPLRAQA